MTQWFDSPLSPGPAPHQKESSIYALRRKVGGGNLMDLLTDDARDDVIDFILRTRHYDDTSRFCLVLAMPEPLEASLLCECHVDLSGDEPAVVITNMFASPGQGPHESLEDLDKFELAPCDFKPCMGDNK